MSNNTPPKSDDLVYATIKYILDKQGEMTAMKLHKLLYYCQAWSLVWDEKPLFNQKIEAWANGPVIPAVYQLHKGQFIVNKNPKWLPSQITGQLTAEQKETIDAVLKVYGDKDSEELSRLTHREDPWRVSRGDTPIGERSANEISHATMAEYYTGLLS